MDMDIFRAMFPSHHKPMARKSLLITGPKETCKTSLLFQIATSLVAKSEDSVLFICVAKVDKVPLHVHQMPKIGAQSAKKISLVYLKTYTDLIKYLAALFMHNQSLKGILIDGVESFLATVVENRDGLYKDCLLKLFALLNDTAGHFTAQGNGICHVAVTCDCKDELVEKATFSSIGLHFFDSVVSSETCSIVDRKKGFRLTDSQDNKTFFYVEEDQIFLHHLSETIAS